MKTSIIAIGNSKGIRIPKLVLEESGLSEEVELKVKRGEIKITAPKASVATVADTALLAESTLGADWNRPEEDKAWARLGSVTS